MNSVSWLLFIAGISENIVEVATGTALLMSLVGGFFEALKRSAIASEDESGAKALALWPHWWKVVLVLICLSVFIPGKNTIYLIAASEMSEMVAETEAAQRIAGKLENVLDSFLIEQSK